MKDGAAAINRKPRCDDSPWSPAKLPVTFPRGRVDVWRVQLDEPRAAASEASVLSPDESARASRFHFETDRIHFIRCRSALRHLLSAYLAIPAAEIAFEYLASGKPQLPAGDNPRTLQFNVSHSASQALVALGSEHRLGVDIEKIRADVDPAALSERFFSARERAGLRALPEHLRVSAFFACWTRKEAFLKATGDGLSFPLSDFSVSTHPDLDPQLEEINGHTSSAKQWRLVDLSAGAGFRAAIACENPQIRIETYSWN